MFFRILIIIFSMCLFAVTGAKAEVICNQKSKVTNIRMGPSAKNYGIADALKNGDQVKVIKKVTNPDGYDYFKIEFTHTQTGKKTTAFVYNESISKNCDAKNTLSAKPNKKLKSNNPSKPWDKKFDNRFARGVSNLKDGSIIVAGNDARVSIGWAIKVDKNGTQIWEKRINKYHKSKVMASAGVQFRGVVLAGYINDGDYKAWATRLDTNGNRVWEWSHQHRHRSSFGESVASFPDGSVLIVGMSQKKQAGQSDAFIARINSKGRQLWNKTFGGEEDEKALGVAVTKDGGAVIVGRYESKNAAWVIKVDKNGIKIWEKFLKGRYTGELRAVKILQDGGILAVGDKPDSGSGDFWVIKFDKHGNIIWEKTFGDRDATANNLALLPNGGALLVGKTLSKGAGGADAWLIKINGNGKLVWDKTYGRSGFDSAYDVTYQKNGDITVVGARRNKGASFTAAWVIRANNVGSSPGAKSTKRTYDNNVSSSSSKIVVNECYSSRTCFNIIKQKGNKLTVRCKKGSGSAGLEQSIFQCKDGGWDSGGFTSCVGASRSMESIGNAVCGRY